MKKVFGERIEGLDYNIRDGVYAVIFNDTKDKVMTVRNGGNHYFLPGGGIENNESNVSCIQREMLEETGYEASIGSYIGNAMRYFKSTNGEPLLSNGYFYVATLFQKVQEPIEDDHYIEWIDIESAKHHLIHEHHYWAIKHILNRKIL